MNEHLIIAVNVNVDSFGKIEGQTEDIINSEKISPLNISVLKHFQP